LQGFFIPAQMTLNDCIGFTGVSILLLAFLLNLSGKLGQQSLPYILLNIVGAGLACLASILIRYTPFIILEASWTLVSIWGLLNYFRAKK
jgi:hypothetical protein